MSKVIITITGPSASGKSTLEAMLVAHPEFCRVVSTTTRVKRASETDQSYYFVTPEQFEATEFVESVEFNGHRYGVSVAEISRIKALGKTPVVVVEPQGREQIERWALDNEMFSIAIFVNGSIKTRLRRLVQRFIGDRFIGKTDFTDKQIDAFVDRLAVATGEELEWSDDYWKYDIEIESFEASNTARVFDSLLSLLREQIASAVSWDDAGVPDRTVIA
jgi:guanylate kinase